MPTMTLRVRYCAILCVRYYACAFPGTISGTHNYSWVQSMARMIILGTISGTHDYPGYKVWLSRFFPGTNSTRPPLYLNAHIARTPLSMLTWCARRQPPRTPHSQCPPGAYANAPLCAYATAHGHSRVQTLVHTILPEYNLLLA